MNSMCRAPHGCVNTPPGRANRSPVAACCAIAVAEHRENAAAPCAAGHCRQAGGHVPQLWHGRHFSAHRPPRDSCVEHPGYGGDIDIRSSRADRRLSPSYWTADQPAPERLMSTHACSGRITGRCFIRSRAWCPPVKWRIAASVRKCPWRSSGQRLMADEASRGA